MKLAAKLVRLFSKRHEDRREAVEELTEEGLSQRQIADVLGVGKSTINRDTVPNETAPTEETLENVPNGTPTEDATEPEEERRRAEGNRLRAEIAQSELRIAKLEAIIRKQNETQLGVS